MKTYFTGRTGQTSTYVLVCLTVLLILSALLPRPGYTAQAAAPQLTGGAPVARTWQPGAFYPQIGPSCAGYALAAWLGSEPHPFAVHPLGWQIYDAAVAQDGIAGPHRGTTVVAAVGVLARFGFVRDWQTTREPGAVLTFLRTTGPVVIEGPFPGDRADFDGAGNLRWSEPLYGHAWFCYQVDTNGRLGCQDSIGTAWNLQHQGRFYMSRASLATVLANGLAWLIQKSAGAPAAEHMGMWAYGREDYYALVSSRPATTPPDWGPREAELHQLFDAGNWGGDATMGGRANPDRITWNGWRAEHVYYIADADPYARKMAVAQAQRDLRGVGVLHVLSADPA